MRRAIIRCPLRFVEELFPGSVWPITGKKNGPHLVGSFHTVAGSAGPLSFGHRGDTSINSVGLRIVNALQLGHRDQASTLLSQLNGASRDLYYTDVVRILEYCARSPDPLFVMETWRVLEGKKLGLSQKCYMLIIRALLTGGYIQEAAHVVKFLGENHRISFLLPLCNYLLSTCVNMKDAMHVNQCLGMMDSLLLGTNEVTYTPLLKLAVWQNDLSAVHEIWREYSKYYNMNIISLRKFIESFTQLKDLVSAYKTLQHMVALALEEGTSLNINMEGKICCQRLDIPIPLNGWRSVIDSHLHYDGHASLESVDAEGMIMNANIPLQCGLLDEGNSMKPATVTRMLEEHKIHLHMLLRWSFSDVIHACARSQNIELAEQLFIQMQNLGVEPTPFLYDRLVRATINGRGVGDAMKFLEVMQKRNLKPYDSTISIISIGCSRALDLDSAEALINQIAQYSYVHPFNAFLQACDLMDQPERAIKILARMRELNIKPDVKTYELLFSLYGNVNAPYEEGNLLSQADVTKRIKAIEMDMLRNGIQHSDRSIRNLLKALGTEGMVQEMLQYLRTAEQQLSHRCYVGTEVYNTVLHSLIEAKEDHIAIQIFRKMKLCRFQLDAATYNIMIDCCFNIRCFKSACALVSMMLRDGFCPQTLTYTALIKILLENDAFDEALNLLQQALSEGNEPDVLLFNSILMKAGLQGRIDVIELVVESMHQMKIQPDPSTCSYVFNAYVDRGFLGTAIEALQVLSLRMISLDHDALEDAKRDYEDLILSEEPEAEAKILRMFKDSENLAAALLNLRWCSICGGSSISWLPHQNPWAKRLARSYAG